MKIQYGCAPKDIERENTTELRARFLVQNLFIADSIQLTYSHIDRMIIGGICPQKTWLDLNEQSAKIGVEYFLKNREIGIIHVGGSMGKIIADDKEFSLEKRDALYLGKGTKQVTFHAVNPADPPKFYINSTPAILQYPNVIIAARQAKPITLGDKQKANFRTLNMYIHPEVSPSNLLLMGITDVVNGNVWNTMPCHIHERRMEAYFYFDLNEEDRVFHYFGQPQETRHIVIANEEAIFSPSWSIHMGVGTNSYSFIWGMTGENQEYNDVDPVAIKDLK